MCVGKAAIRARFTSPAFAWKGLPTALLQANTRKRRLNMPRINNFISFIQSEVPTFMNNLLVMSQY